MDQAGTPVSSFPLLAAAVAALLSGAKVAAAGGDPVRRGRSSGIRNKKELV